ncbi:RsiV family protein [Bordetella petrii]|uniref:Lipoprotein n=1 Tax=Bordetella petrii (strain ATCC BAA-461 / DSM 12804 / CCUG 43448 / CIP 107267 / Se-1111R) TaxID=340100 RepID=A9INH1_BORPD|nr:RsiV family protein [Bordetella petrii]CAP42834.1 putative lipoprotein [Bordetella petrii]
MRFFCHFPDAPRFTRACLAGAALAVLAGCASSPSDTISLPPSTPQPTATEAQVRGLNVEKLQWQGAKPGCQGQCPRIEIDSVAFPDIPKLTELVDHVLAYMTGVDPNRPRPYRTISEYTQYFWQTAQSRDTTIFKASVKAVVGNIVAVELHTGQYLTGAAHGIPATQYLNWQRDQSRVLALDEALQPGARPAFVEALRRAHTAWLATNPDAQRDPQAYDRMWPFQESNNFALTPEGVVVKYDAYSIAPYSHGEPELLIPYAELRGILRPEFMPPA